VVNGEKNYILRVQHSDLMLLLACTTQSMRLAKVEWTVRLSLTCVQQQVSAEDRAEAARCYVSLCSRKAGPWE
jgi:alkylation response protein AidB-like acyl-CoA dehydrogenase